MRVHRSATIAIALLSAVNTAQPAAAIDEGGGASSQVHIGVPIRGDAA